MKRNIVIQKITEMDALESILHLENQIWGNATPVHQTYTAINNGGLMLGAYDGDKLIGFSYSFTGYDGQEVYLYSHMLGLLPDYRKAGLGERMKRKQAEIADQMGYEKMIWTFDPLQSLNAYLNMNKLGATGVKYKENYYGDMDDGLNRGMATDRIIIEWHWNEDKSLENVQTVIEEQVLLLEKEGMPISNLHADQNLKENAYFVSVPNNIQEIKSNQLELAIDWRMKTRAVFNCLFKQGYRAKGFIRDDNKKIGYYCFQKK
ncbi:MAG: GNAT family N-acetyltransferase [Bacillota bacterium]|uniref:GNAT family N-acetyltransferase n=1 Tax=Virgibacillus salarius TaxID=447199 RepID=A0A941IBZ1_9BACI|nr:MULTISPECIES: GNAT family N-acetyltransferase [Bacillaceae]NAZ11012.1 GNAT family N-acetyltransferase [Agaribacter marinus]MBR7798303.1 GNAT family N-acetyltransferase [Virgibacillus salarius]MCC2252435.1 GNAT family N-acetyltransferase [Virgibacillus sp. AGTR]MDY7044119.1 GNAT family N-acetyltransferase [Virgibacillus sp. M23]QRZ18223.1 GNAT family N-acetyltransferase [Virgibacillus sp. AGTR]